MEDNKEKIRYIIQFFFDKGKNASQATEIVITVTNTVTANYVQFWFRRFRSSIFDVKNASRTGRPVVENVNKITDVIKFDRHVSSRSAQELKIVHKTVLNHLRKVGLAKKEARCLGATSTPKNMMDQISTSQALANRIEIDSFL
ncbi:histone-lysine N-methyltransferase SETMAR [Trichonephila clavipes]|nr:histone-lysine N-methyltransferase SETMAR [Trichonephila clavipes]